MATVIGDFASGIHHNMVFQPQSRPHIHQQQSPPPQPQRLRSSSGSRDSPQQNPPLTSSRRPPTAASSSPPITTSSSTSSSAARLQRQGSQQQRDQPRTADWTKAAAADSNEDAASRFPTPPDSSSPSVASTSAVSRPRQDAGGSSPGCMDTGDSQPNVSSTSDPPSAAASDVTVVQPFSTTTTTTTIPPANSIPSPASDTFPSFSAPAPAPTPTPAATTQRTIKIRDLAHIHSLARADLVTGNGPGILNDPPLSQMKYEISEMPIGDIIEMVAALLTKITTTNDLQHDAMNRNAAHQRQAQQVGEGSSKSIATSTSSPFASSVLAFHGKNVPAITILSYLSRIHKYCPTTFEVFLSLLVYFDRMTERVNDMVIKSEQEKEQQQSTEGEDVVMHESDEDLADSTDGDEDVGGVPKREEKKEGGGKAASSSATFFVVDSFNIHRLIIAGVTCASKFFSDVFYTNSRYAKVGGLPLAELNHLELQFLLLNDFRLAVPVEDLEAYATMLVEFYAREVVAQRSRPAASSASE